MSVVQEIYCGCQMEVSQALENTWKSRMKIKIIIFALVEKIENGIFWDFSSKNTFLNCFQFGKCKKNSGENYHTHELLGWF